MYEPIYTILDKETGKCIAKGKAPECIKALGVCASWFYATLEGSENPKWNIKRRLMRYSVYDKKTDLPVIVYGTAKECREAMGIGQSGFSKALHVGAQRKWIIIPEGYEDEE